MKKSGKGDLSFDALPSIPAPYQPQTFQSNRHPLTFEKWAQQQILEFKDQMPKRGTSFQDLCPFPSAKLPEGYVPQSIEFRGVWGDPRIHLQSFYNACPEVHGNDGALNRLFLRSLAEEALDWFATLKTESISTFQQMRHLEGDFLIDS